MLRPLVNGWREIARFEPLVRFVFGVWFFRMFRGKTSDLLRALAGGKGGGKPDQARGAAPDRSKLEEIKSAATQLFIHP
jgi:alanyl-tRNA synthetase